MSLEWVELLAYVLFGFKWLAFILACALLLMGLDDLFIDLSYWLRTLWRRLRIYRRNPYADEQRLFEAREQPLAVMVPAWQETGVIGQMARLAASTLDYENYQIFVGTYPNDPATQAEVDEVCQRFHNVHKVVCARPGPTSKADCLNNIIDAILRFEQQARIEFAGFILHDAEDVISPLELRLFNYLLPRKDLIQVPVYPFPPAWHEFTGGHYIDEFAEQHGKDVVVREAMVGQVPSAGVGTCFSRRAIAALLQEKDGIAFDVQSLTEDYEIGMRLAEKGMSGIFARFMVSDPRYATHREHKFGVVARASKVICVREHFPRTFSQAVRQKSRWIIGIVFQGMRSMGWSSRPLLNYFLWRDRRGGITNLIGFLVNLVFLVVLLMWLVGWVVDDAWQFLSLLGGSDLLRWLLICNGILLLNRLFQRFYFVTSYYGLWQGLLSAPRMVWSNVVNFFANIRAIRQVLLEGDPRRVAWDKTDHEFPEIGEPKRIPLGQRLVAMGAISQSDLQAALLAGAGRRIGRELLSRGLITSTQLAKALADQAGAEYSELSPFKLDSGLIARLPARLALRYAVLPMAEEGRTLVLASERALSEVSIGALARQLRRPVSYRIVPQGRVTLGLRYWYVQQAKKDERLERLAQQSSDETLMEAVCRHQVMLGDLVQEMGMLPSTLFAQAMFDFDPLQQSLGEYLKQRGLISSELLEQALQEQKAQQALSWRALEVLP
ncbi:glycosyl transferase family protein [Halopseudomonas salegens]|uniref:Adsorption protein B n=1 Tax=Halopseudomonas salegens TaxID=1434072 RepID=A0A1H2E5Z8_9GAMM|nr:glycosyl transferase family protein [Halopseudomonas salegens]SDT90465.1 adsorption protein B [Halopseudomonas salegens]